MALCVVGGFAGIVWGQTPPKVGPTPVGPIAPEEAKKTNAPREVGTVHFETKIGSFKSISGHGSLEFTFRGTVLLSDYKGAKPVFEGKVRKEYEGNGKIVYSGVGKIKVVGEWRGVQWFGKDMKGIWVGDGILRITGEFDKELKTGTYYFDDPKKIYYWPTSTYGLTLPERKALGEVEPVERSKTQPGKTK
jgi:hypothetical protein